MFGCQNKTSPVPSISRQPVQEKPGSLKGSVSSFHLYYIRTSHSDRSSVSCCCKTRLSLVLWSSSSSRTRLLRSLSRHVILSLEILKSNNFEHTQKTLRYKVTNNSFTTIASIKTPKLRVRTPLAFRNSNQTPQVKLANTFRVLPCDDCGEASIEHITHLPRTKTHLLHRHHHHHHQ